MDSAGKVESGQGSLAVGVRQAAIIPFRKSCSEEAMGWGQGKESGSLLREHSSPELIGRRNLVDTPDRAPLPSYCQTRPAHVACKELI